MRFPADAPGSLRFRFCIASTPLRLRRYATKGDTFGRAALYEEQALAKQVATAQGVDAVKVDASNVYEFRSVKSASDVLMRLMNHPVGTNHPPVTDVPVYELGKEEVNMPEGANIEEAADKYVGKLERYLSRPLPMFQDYTFCEYYGRTGNVTLERFQRRRSLVPAGAVTATDRVVRNPHVVWRKRAGCSTLCRITPGGSFNSERYWIRQLLLLPGHMPTSWNELCEYDGDTYGTASEAADARGLSSNGKLAELSMREEAGDRLSSGRRLRAYLVSLLTTLDECKNLLDLVSEFLPQLSAQLEIGAGDDALAAVLRVRVRPLRAARLPRVLRAFDVRRAAVRHRPSCAGHRHRPRGDG